MGLSDLSMWRMYTVRPYIPTACASRTEQLQNRVKELEAEVKQLKEELGR